MGTTVSRKVLREKYTRIKARLDTLNLFDAEQSDAMDADVIADTFLVLKEDMYAFLDEMRKVFAD